MWQAVAVLYGGGGGIGGFTGPIPLHTYSTIFGEPANPGPYTSGLLVTEIITHTTVTAVTDNIGGAHTKMVSVLQPDGKGELSLWIRGPLDYPAATGITVSVTVSAGADTQTNGQAVILIPQVGDTLYTGGVFNHSASTSGNGNGLTPVPINLAVICDTGTQYAWGFGVVHGNDGTVDTYGGDIGTGGDLNGVPTYIGSATYAANTTTESVIWVPVTPLGTGSRDNSYSLIPDLDFVYAWVAAAASFTKPAGSTVIPIVLTNPGATPNLLSFSGNMEALLTSAHPRNALVTQRRSIKPK